MLPVQAGRALRGRVSDEENGPLLTRGVHALAAGLRWWPVCHGGLCARGRRCYGTRASPQQSARKGAFVCTDIAPLERCVHCVAFGRDTWLQRVLIKSRSKGLERGGAHGLARRPCLPVVSLTE